MKVLVTGAAGYIGSVLCRILSENGHGVYACDLNSMEHIERYCEQTVQFSFESLPVMQLIHMGKIQTIIHLAATSTVGPDATNPILYYENNVSRTILFIDRLKRLQKKPNIIFASTAAVYGAQIFKMTETSPLNPINVYGHTKLVCERILSSADVYGFQSTSFRFFNVVGAYDDLGEEALDTHLLSRICQAASGGPPLTIFGNDYSTRDGSCVRDYVHVIDICNAMVRAIDFKHQGSKTYNLGTGEGTSVLQMIAAFEKHTGVQVPIKETGYRREGDPASLIANGELFKTTYNFQYDNSCLYKMITTSWDHYKFYKWSNNGV